MKALLILLSILFVSVTFGQDVDTLHPKLERKITRDDLLKVDPIDYKLTAELNKSGVIVLTIEIPCDNVYFESIGGKQVSKVLFNLHVVGDKGLPNGYLEGIETTKRDVSELLDVNKCRPFVIERRVSLPRGHYKIEAVVRHVQFYDRAKKKIKLTIP